MIPLKLVDIEEAGIFVYLLHGLFLHRIGYYKHYKPRPTICKLYHLPIHKKIALNKIEASVQISIQNNTQWKVWVQILKQSFFVENHLFQWEINMSALA